MCQEATLFVDEVGLREEARPEVARARASGIEEEVNVGCLGSAQGREEALQGVHVFVPGDQDELDWGGALVEEVCHFEEGAQFFLARGTPGGPQGEDDDPSLKGAEWCGLPHLIVKPEVVGRAQVDVAAEARQGPPEVWWHGTLWGQGEERKDQRGNPPQAAAPEARWRCVRRRQVSSRGARVALFRHGWIPTGRALVA